MFSFWWTKMERTGFTWVRKSYSIDVPYKISSSTLPINIQSSGQVLTIFRGHDVIYSHAIVHVVLHTAQICRTSACTIIYNLVQSSSVVFEKDLILGTLGAPAFPSTSWQLCNHIWWHAFLHLYTSTIGTLQKSPQTFNWVRFDLSSTPWTLSL